MPLAWHDLLGRPWKLHGDGLAGMDCSTVAEEVLRRLGFSPPTSNPFRLPFSEGEEGEMGAYFGYLEEGYIRLGESLSDATEAGDLVLARDEHGMARRLYILVEPSRGTFLTSAHNYGVVAVRRFVIKDVAGVYRIRGQE
jgi:hypothetical protein